MTRQTDEQTQAVRVLLTQDVCGNLVSNDRTGDGTIQCYDKITEIDKEKE